MERACYVSNGGIKVPIGYRFRPTEAELLIHYLRPKVSSIPFPASVIPELDVFHTDPWSLPGNMDEKRYFFSGHRKMNVLDGKRGIATGSGYWKPVGKDKIIVAPQSNQPIGVRKTLVFRQNKRIHGTKTRWFVHQFCLLGSKSTQDWAVYCLFQKKRHRVSSKLKNAGEELSSRSNFTDSPRSSSCCSGVTDVEDSANKFALLDQEASSA